MKPILFNTEMVKAILAGNKNTTRRPMKPQPLFYTGRRYIFEDESCPKKWEDCDNIISTYQYQPGDILYVRETWERLECECCEGDFTGRCFNERDDNNGCYVYRATHEITGDARWKPSIHMPREAARIFLKVTEVRVERVQDITPKSACGEGVTHILNPGHPLREKAYARGHWDEEAQDWFAGSVHAFAALWDSVYKNWSDNPWVWVIKFERCTEGGEKIA